MESESFLSKHPIALFIAMSSATVVGGYLIGAWTWANIQTWTMVVSAELIIGTIIFKKTLKVWWWEKPDPKKWNVGVSQTGIDIHMAGADPLEAIRNLFESWFPPSPEQELSIEIDRQAAIMMKNLLKTPEMQKRIKELALEKVKSMFKTVKDGKDG